MNRTGYSIPKSNSSHNDFGDYCNYCVINFKVFNPLIQNVCQSCGRVAKQVIADKQPEQQLTSINDPAISSHNTLKAISQEIDYNPMFTNDETKEGISSGNVTKQAKSLDEATEWLNMMDSSSRSIQLQNKLRYHIKTNTKRNKNIIDRY